MFDFTVTSRCRDTRARTGVFETAHGAVRTPVFMPVGTLGTVKALSPEELVQCGAQIILGNTYHLYLRPGCAVIERFAGLHRFMNWHGPILTDSGGYQVYSLSHRRKITEEGVEFASHIDGSKHFFSPERSMEIQRSIGADIVMAFDECPAYPSDYQYARDSMELTHRWLERCVAYMDGTRGKYGYEQTLFPIVQGSSYEDLRRRSAEFVADLGRPGNAIGGLSVGEPTESMYQITRQVCDILPADKPRYLMGVGTPANILECIARGVDMFDCVLPTRNARHGMLYTREGIINIKNAKWKADFSPVDPDGAAPTSRFYNKAYLRHLLHSNEMLGRQIASLHNLGFYLWLVREARKRILAGDFQAWKEELVPKLARRL